MQPPAQPQMSSPAKLSPPNKAAKTAKPGPAKGSMPVSSLPLGKFLYFDFYFTLLYFIIEYLLYIYKGFRFYYPPSILAVEVVSLTFLFIYELLRIHFGTTGNKVESTVTMAWFLVLVAPAIIGFIFFLKLQTYVLLIDAILSATALVFVSAEAILAIFAFLSFRSYQKLE